MDGLDVAEITPHRQASRRPEGRGRTGGNHSPCRVRPRDLPLYRLGSGIYFQGQHSQFSPDGLALQVDVGQVDPAFSGQLSLHYKTAIPEPVLTTIPRRSLSFAVPREWVLRAVGVPAPRPVQGLG
jgi:hypothetical protein